MRLPLLLLVLLAATCAAQDTTLNKVLSVKDGKVHYETSFILELPQDTLLERGRKWMTSQKGYQNNLYFGRVEDLRTSILEQYYKCRIAFFLPFTADSKHAKTPKQLTYMYTIRYYVNNKFRVQIIIDDVSLSGNLATLGLALDKTINDMIRVEDFRAMQHPTPNSASAARMRTLVYNNYKQADAYFKNCLKQLIAASFNKPLNSLENAQVKK